MKKTAVFILFILCFFAVSALCVCSSANPALSQYDSYGTMKFPFANSAEDNPENREINTFQLPSSLKTIEEKAFEGTNASVVELPGNITTIGEFAFANIAALRKINLPDTILFIGENAFDGSRKVAIAGTLNGYAHAWAEENGIPFLPVTSYYALNLPVQFTSLSKDRAEQRKLLPDSETHEVNNQRPAGFMAGEPEAERYEGFSILQIQGRSPPMC